MNRQGIPLHPLDSRAAVPIPDSTNYSHYEITPEDQQDISTNAPTYQELNCRQRTEVRNVLYHTEENLSGRLIDL